jgi:hypothetical protein
LRTEATIAFEIDFFTALSSTSLDIRHELQKSARGLVTPRGQAVAFTSGRRRFETSGCFCISAHDAC